MNGTVCMEDWDDSDANATCHMIGYKGGVVFGPQEVYSRSMPVWYTQFNCTGSEGSLADCPSSPHVSLNCVRSIKNAGVLCYNTTGIKMIAEISHRHNDFIHCFVLFCLNLVDNVFTLWKESLNSDDQQFSTNVNKTNNNLSPQIIIKKMPQTYDIGNLGPVLRQTQKCGRIKPVNVIPILPSW
jgi:hypothetical protein